VTDYIIQQISTSSEEEEEEDDDEDKANVTTSRMFTNS